MRAAAVAAIASAPPETPRTAPAKGYSGKNLGRTVTMEELDRAAKAASPQSGGGGDGMTSDADMISMYVRASLIQLHTPDSMRGRVSSVSMIFISASNELGEFESGVTAAWLGPAARGGPLLTAADASLVQQQALLAALEATPSTVPRLLVTHHPVETAGPHGQGGLFPDSAYGLHPEPLRRAISHGVFAGALSGRDRNISASADIFDAVKRSSRFWLPHPMFQVVSGATAHPDGSASGGRRSWLYYQSQSLMPDLFSNRAGFAELIVGPETYAAQLHQRRRGRWRAAQIEVPRERPPHPVETPSPVMDPCLRCDPLRPNQ